MGRTILKELKEHAPFTALGALSGVILMIFFQKVPCEAAYDLFYIFHPIHVLLSALVTTSMYEKHKCGKMKKECSIWVLLIIGYAGSIGIATLSDSLIPYAGETLLNMPQRHVHLGFIEKWWLINPLAIAGIAVAYFKSTTKFPHYGHVFLSTWASLFHMLMAVSKPLSWLSYIAVFVFLFLSVWLPCCISDIVFPLLFVKKSKNNV